MEKSKLYIPIYLNQRVVFDMLAILEDGFSMLSKIDTSISRNSKESGEMGAEIGISNIFAFLGVKMKGNLSEEDEKSNNQTISQEKIHTPTSLFAKLHNQLLKTNDIKLISNNQDMSELKPGNFIEFSGILSKNPLISLMESFQMIGELAVAFEGGTDNNRNQQKNRNSENKKMLSQVKLLTENLKSGNMLDLICDVYSTEIKVVLPVYIDYFFNKSMNEIIDGQYRIIGKVTKIVEKGSSESISLLRNTTFSLMQKNMMDGLMGNFESLDNSGFNIPSITTEVYGPALQIIPIAIYA